MSSPLRVTFVTHYAELYGANLSLLALIDGLRPLGVEARVFGPDRGDLIDALTARGVPAAVLPFEWWVSTERSPEDAAGRAYRNLRHLRAITRQLAEWGTDLVYSNASVFNIGAMMECENIAIVRGILDALGGDPALITHVRDRPAHDRRYAMDATRVRTETGWRSRVEFNEGARGYGAVVRRA